MLLTAFTVNPRIAFSQEPEEQSANTNQPSDANKVKLRIILRTHRFEFKDKVNFTMVCNDTLLPKGLEKEIKNETIVELNITSGKKNISCNISVFWNKYNKIFLLNETKINISNIISGNLVNLTLILGNYVNFTVKFLLADSKTDVKPIYFNISSKEHYPLDNQLAIGTKLKDGRDTMVSFSIFNGTFILGTYTVESLVREKGDQVELQLPVHQLSLCDTPCKLDTLIEVSANISVLSNGTPIRDGSFRITEGYLFNKSCLKEMKFAGMEVEKIRGKTIRELIESKLAKQVGARLVLNVSALDIRLKSYYSPFYNPYDRLIYRGKIVLLDAMGAPLRVNGTLKIGSGPLRQECRLSNGECETSLWLLGFWPLLNSSAQLQGVLDESEGVSLRVQIKVENTYTGVYSITILALVLIALVTLLLISPTRRKGKAPAEAIGEEEEYYDEYYELG